MIEVIAVERTVNDDAEYGMYCVTYSPRGYHFRHQMYVVARDAGDAVAIVERIVMDDYRDCY